MHRSVCLRMTLFRSENIGLRTLSEREERGETSVECCGFAVKVISREKGLETGESVVSGRRGRMETVL